MMPLITRRSSTRRGPVWTIDKGGLIAAHCMSFSQNSRDTVHPPLFDSANQPQRPLVNWVQTLAEAQKRATEAAGTKVRLLKLVAAGALDAEDPQLTEELKTAEARRQRAAEEIALLEGQGTAATPRAIPPAKIERLGTVIRDAVKNGPPEFRIAYVRQFDREVVVDDDEIRVSGPTTALAVAKEEADAALNQGSQGHREWRRVRNPGESVSRRDVSDRRLCPPV